MQNPKGNSGSQGDQVAVESGGQRSYAKKSDSPEIDSGLSYLQTVQSWASQFFFMDIAPNSWNCCIKRVNKYKAYRPVLGTQQSQKMLASYYPVLFNPSDLFTLIFISYYQTTKSSTYLITHGTSHNDNGKHNSISQRNQPLHFFRFPFDCMYINMFSSFNSSLEESLIVRKMIYFMCFQLYTQIYSNYQILSNLFYWNFDKPNT